MRAIETKEGGKREIKIHTFFLNNLIRLPYLILRLSNSLELSRQHININNRLKGTLELLKFNDSILQNNNVAKRVDLRFYGNEKESLKQNISINIIFDINYF